MENLPSTLFFISSPPTSLAPSLSQATAQSNFDRPMDQANGEDIDAREEAGGGWRRSRRRRRSGLIQICARTRQGSGLRQSRCEAFIESAVLHLRHGSSMEITKSSSLSLSLSLPLLSLSLSLSLSLKVSVFLLPVDWIKLRPGKCPGSGQGDEK